MDSTLQVGPNVAENICTPHFFFFFFPIQNLISSDCYAEIIKEHVGHWARLCDGSCDFLFFF